MCKTGAVKKAIFGMRELEIGKKWTRLEEVFVFAYVCDFFLSWEMFKSVSMMGKGPRNYRDQQCERSKIGAGRGGRRGGGGKERGDGAGVRRLEAGIQSIEGEVSTGQGKEHTIQRE